MGAKGVEFLKRLKQVGDKIKNVGNKVVKSLPKVTNVVKKIADVAAPVIGMAADFIPGVSGDAVTNAVREGTKLIDKGANALVDAVNKQQKRIEQPQVRQPIRNYTTNRLLNPSSFGKIRRNPIN